MQWGRRITKIGVVGLKQAPHSDDRQVRIFEAEEAKREAERPRNNQKAGKRRHGADRPPHLGPDAAAMPTIFGPSSRPSPAFSTWMIGMCRIIRASKANGGSLSR